MVIDLIVPLGDRVIDAKKAQWRCARLVMIENQWNFIRRQYLGKNADRQILVDFVNSLGKMSARDYTNFLKKDMPRGNLLLSYRKLPDGYLQYKAQ